MLPEAVLKSQDFSPFADYAGLFVQRIPRYAVKLPGSTWQTRRAALHDVEVQKHLAGQQAVACLARWYPEYAALDFDNVTRGKVDEVRGGLGLADANSLLFASESPNSFHLYFRPEYHHKPPTVSLLQTILKPFAKARGVEVYPQRNRAFRLPFGKGQDCLDHRLESWEQKLFWLQKVDDFDLGQAPGHQGILDFGGAEPGTRLVSPGGLQPTADVAALLREGLPGPSTRDWAQFELIKHLWRQNVSQDDCQRLIWAWLCQKNNGFSKDLASHPDHVRAHLKHQVAEYYNRMEFHFTLPDRPHLAHKGFITEPDLVEIVHLCQGSLPRMKFAFNLVKYMNPRRHREKVPIHSDRFIEWSSMDSYQGHLNYLEAKGVVQRSTGYLVGKKSKALKLKWQYQNDQKAVLWGGRAVETMKDALSLIFKPADFCELLRRYLKRTTAIMATRAVFEGVKKQGTYNT